MRKRKIVIFLLFLIIVAVVYGLYFYFGRKMNANKTEDSDIRLLNPELLYYSSSWYGMCRNDQGEEGGCSNKVYLYSTGRFVEEVGWSVGDDLTIVPREKKFSADSIKKIENLIRDSGLMTMNCPDGFIFDAGWDYRINLDGEKRSFHNPPRDCRDLFKGVDKLIDSMIEKNEDVSDSVE